MNRRYCQVVVFHIGGIPVSKIRLSPLRFFPSVTDPEPLGALFLLLPEPDSRLPDVINLWDMPGAQNRRRPPSLERLLGCGAPMPSQ